MPSFIIPSAPQSVSVLASDAACSSNSAASPSFSSSSSEASSSTPRATYPLAQLEEDLGVAAAIFGDDVQSIDDGQHGRCIMRFAPRFGVLELNALFDIASANDQGPDAVVFAPSIEVRSLVAGISGLDMYAAHDRLRALWELSWGELSVAMTAVTTTNAAQDEENSVDSAASKHASLPADEARAKQAFARENFVYDLLTEFSEINIDLVGGDDRREDDLSEESEASYENDGSAFDGSVDRVRQMMGRLTPEGIVQQIGSNIKLLHAEVVIRRHLLARFDRRREELVQSITNRSGSSRRARDQQADELSKIDIVYHGTPRHNVSKIVTNGFLVPGTLDPTTKSAHQIRCGSTWGAGIYSSPEASYVTNYGDATAAGSIINGRRVLSGRKVIVCAVLMGRRRQLQHGEFHRKSSEPHKGFHSHVSPSKLEWVVFDPGQILPLMVLHIDWVMGGAHESLGALQRNGIAGRDSGLLKQSYLAAGDDELSVKQQQKRLTDHARKHFPLGFGPAGQHFVVEEIGEVDDDEELWGEYTSSASSGVRDEFSEGRSMR